jgi:hypothetical protein
MREVSNGREFCVGRMVTKVGLVKVATSIDFSTAQRRVTELAKTWPGDYVVFHRDTGRVVAKISAASEQNTVLNGSSREPYRRAS